MDYLNAIRRGIAQLIGIPAGITASASLPGGEFRASLPVAEVPLPGQTVRLVTAPVATAPVASAAPVAGPGQLVRGNPPELAELITAIGTVRRFLPTAAKPALARAMLPAPAAAKAKDVPDALDADGTPVATPPKSAGGDDNDPDFAAKLVETLLGIFQKIKDANLATSDDEAGDNKATARARALLAAGTPHAAIKVVSSRILALTPTHALSGEAALKQARAKAHRRLFAGIQASKPVALAESASVETRRNEAKNAWFAKIR